AVFGFSADQTPDHALCGEAVRHWKRTFRQVALRSNGRAIRRETRLSDNDAGLGSDTDGEERGERGDRPRMFEQAVSDSFAALRIRQRRAADLVELPLWIFQARTLCEGSSGWGRRDRGPWVGERGLVSFNFKPVSSLSQFQF